MLTSKAALLPMIPMGLPSVWRMGQMTFRRNPVPDSEVPVPDSEVPVPDSEVPVPDSEVPVPDSEVPVPDSIVRVERVHARPRTAAVRAGMHECSRSSLIGNMKSIQT
jgi:hypothetical protein